ncbi:hypothetical protein CEP53_009984 [Fusarium sp. AF-6]|nr:hypothetical protein CEP53_009984 [Fusarium sp. AF-6]
MNIDHANHDDNAGQVGHHCYRPDSPVLKRQHSIEHPNNTNAHPIPKIELLIFLVCIEIRSILVIGYPDFNYNKALKYMHLTSLGARIIPPSGRHPSIKTIGYAVQRQATPEPDLASLISYFGILKVGITVDRFRMGLRSNR